MRGDERGRLCRCRIVESPEYGTADSRVSATVVEVRKLVAVSAGENTEQSSGCEARKLVATCW